MSSVPDEEKLAWPHGLCSQCCKTLQELGTGLGLGYRSYTTVSNCQTGGAANNLMSLDTIDQDSGNMTCSRPGRYLCRTTPAMLPERLLPRNRVFRSLLCSIELGSARWAACAPASDRADTGKLCNTTWYEVLACVLQRLAASRIGLCCSNGGSFCRNDGVIEAVRPHPNHLE